MVLEVAMLSVHAGEESAFEEAMVEAAPVIAGSRGYLGHQLQRCIETKGRYVLLVRWGTLEAHTIGFRESPAFVEWRTLIGPYLEAAPLVEHYDNVLSWPQK